MTTKELNSLPHRRWTRHVLVPVLVAALFMPCTLVAKHTRHGEQVRVVKSDGGETRGELLRVSDESLLVQNASDTGEAIRFTDIVHLAIQKSNSGRGALIGLGVCLTSAVAVSACGEQGCWSPSERMKIWGTVTAIPLTLIGAAIGGLSHHFKPYPLANDPGERQAQLARLHDIARFQ